MSKQIGLYLDPIMNPGGVKFPVKRGTFDFIEQSWIEGIRSSILSIIGDSYSPTKVYILNGCKSTSILGVTHITSGSVFFNGEIFQHTLQAFTNPSVGNVVIANMQSVSWQPTDLNGDTYADPVNFIGASPANIHIDRTVTFLSGASGSGNLTGNSNSDYLNMINIQTIWESTGISLSVGGGGGSVSTPTIIYNKYKFLNNNTIVWQIRLSNINITGTVTALILKMNPILSFSFVNTSSRFFSVFNQTDIIFASLGVNEIDVFYPTPGTPFAVGSNYYLDVNIEAEIN